jgi:hypothetical protein
MTEKCPRLTNIFNHPQSVTQWLLRYSNSPRVAPPVRPVVNFALAFGTRDVYVDDITHNITARIISIYRMGGPPKFAAHMAVWIRGFVYVGMDQYLLIPFLGGWTSIYQLFWCSPGVQGFDTLPCINSLIFGQFIFREFYDDPWTVDHQESNLAGWDPRNDQPYRKLPEVNTAGITEAWLVSKQYLNYLKFVNEVVSRMSPYATIILDLICWDLFFRSSFFIIFFECILIFFRDSTSLFSEDVDRFEPWL